MKLRDWRIEMGWSQDALAAEMEVDRTTIARWEAGKRDPSADDKERLFLLSDGKVEPNDFYDVPAWRRVLSSMLHKLGAAA